MFEADGGRIKVNPLAHWSAENVKAHADRYDLPAHPLAAEGYLSIGCVPCTSRVRPGEEETTQHRRSVPRRRRPGCSAAIGRPVSAEADPEGKYATLATRPDEIGILLQLVDHPSRVHLDIESDDIEADVQRLKNYGVTVVRDGELLVTHGPFSEAAEVVGGLYVIAAPTADEAVAVASAIPAGAGGAVEVRPVLEVG